MGEGEENCSSSESMSIYNPADLPQDTSLGIVAQNLNISEDTLPRLNCSLGSQVIQRDHPNILGENEISTQYEPFDLR